MATKKPLTDKKFWDQDWQAYQRHSLLKQFVDSQYHFADSIFQRFLKYDPKISFLEVGCVPGSAMIYFAKKFGYKVFGLDYSDEIRLVGPNLKAQGIEDFELFQCEFLEFSPSEQYDVVASFGFVEHFAEVDRVFKKHCDLLRPGGILIISLPNFRYFQKILRLLFGAQQTFDHHNLEVMFPYIWRRLAEKEGLSILFCDYYLTFKFWLPVSHNVYLQLLVASFSTMVNKLLQLLQLDQISNRYLSPHILLIAAKL